MPQTDMPKSKPVSRTSISKEDNFRRELKGRLEWYINVEKTIGRQITRKCCGNIKKTNWGIIYPYTIGV